MCATPPFATAKANGDRLISVVEDLWPLPSPTPVDFTNRSDGNEMFLKSGRIFVWINRRSQQHCWWRRNAGSSSRWSWCIQMVGLCLYYSKKAFSLDEKVEMLPSSKLIVQSTFIVIVTETTKCLVSPKYWFHNSNNNNSNNRQTVIVIINA